MTEQTGGCLCGAVRFRLVGPPYEIDYCHCHSCRKHTARPAETWTRRRTPASVRQAGQPGCGGDMHGLKGLAPMPMPAAVMTPRQNWPPQSRL